MQMMREHEEQQVEEQERRPQARHVPFQRREIWLTKSTPGETREQLEKQKEAKRLKEEKLKQKQERIEQEKKRQEQLLLEQEQQKQKEEKIQKEAELELKIKSEEKEKEKKNKLQEISGKILEMNSTTTEKQEKEKEIEKLPFTKKAEGILEEAKNIGQMEMKKDELSESATKRVEALLTNAENLLCGLNFDSKSVKTSIWNGQEKPSSKNELSTQLEIETESEADIFFDAVTDHLPSISGQQQEVGKAPAEDKAADFTLAPSKLLERAEQKPMNEIKYPEKKETKKVIESPKREVRKKAEKKEEMKLDISSRPISFQFEKRAPPLTSQPKQQIQIQNQVQKMEKTSRKMEPAQNIQIQQVSTQFEKEIIGNSSNWSNVRVDRENLRLGKNADFEYESEPESDNKNDECCPVLAFILPCIFAPLK